jgi:hypothetical protein
MPPLGGFANLLSDKAKKLNIYKFYVSSKGGRSNSNEPLADKAHKQYKKEAALWQDL